MAKLCQQRRHHDHPLNCFLCKSEKNLVKIYHTIPKIFLVNIFKILATTSQHEAWTEEPEIRSAQTIHQPPVKTNSRLDYLQGFPQSLLPPLHPA